jgi:hypothetical protein
MMRWSASVFAVLILLLATLTVARGQSLFEKLVTPGDVVQPHAKFEKDCGSCHESFSKKSQRRLCLDCHKDISADLATKTGFHGRSREIGTAECKNCHTEHKGRGADIIRFDSETFNHDVTDFKLVGVHARASCSDCHAKAKKYRDAPSGCFACHKGDDAHKGALGENCATCHNEEAWRKPKAFDHSKTKFPLKGAHERVQCSVCHIGERYKGLPQECVSCHTIQDVHGGRYGGKCDNCHTSSKWGQITFDHAKATAFPLKGAHANIKCARCHQGDLYRDKLSTACVACHKATDPHDGQLGSKCQTCHNETSWRQKVTFDHDVTRFPLIGLHASVPCEECHRTESYRGAPKNCAGCHTDAFHKGSLGSACDACHNPNGWTLWRFNHDRDTNYPLTGAHIGLKCSACHKVAAAPKIVALRECVGCHKADDAHRGAFGPLCEKCHSTLSFRQATVRQ